MATKSMAYDHAAYIVPYVFSGHSAAGANGASPKWTAFTAMKLKSVQQGVVVASTSASQSLMYTKSGTTTSTTTLTALTSASVAPINNAVSVDMAQGDQFWCVHGTDATTSIAWAVEANVTPGATVTA